jgi:tungstate transport system substrate-binding protein
MKVTTLAAIALIAIIVTGIAAYTAGYYTQNNGQPQPTPTPTPSPSSSPTLTVTPTPGASPTPTRSPTPTPVPTASPSPTPTPMPSTTTLRVATTTSLYDTGLEDTPETLKNGTVVKDDLKDSFQAKYPWITVNFIALGTGAAIAQAQRGDADMLLVHSPAQELTFLKGGFGVDRKIIAYNFFIIVGPTNNLAGITSTDSVSDALVKIYNAPHTGSNPVYWFSRNDASGTNTKEISLWNAVATITGQNYTQLTNSTANPWFKSTGTGMGQTLLATNYYGSTGGYTIADTGTYLAYSTRGDIQLKVLVQGQESLLNVYSAIIDDPRNANLANTNFAASLLFVNYLASTEGQQLIGNYGVSLYNQSLFTPFVPLATGIVSNPQLLGWIKSYAYMSSDAYPIISASGTECPSQYRYNEGTLFSITYIANSNANISINVPNYYIVDKPKTITSQAIPAQNNKLYIV